jgi:glycine/D-amino acid oxidase-like deaminating enzyme/nitrite reductase/ring-hydroxylating ferredoxin subunit
MKANDGLTQPVWTQGYDLPTYPAPTPGDKADVIVVGGGIAGLTTAYLLAKEGHDVMLLDEGPIGRGQTERTSAHLSSIIDDRFYMIEKQHDAETARLAHESHASAIDRIERITREESISCDFARLPAYLFPGPEGQEKEIRKEAEPAARAGATVHLQESVPGLTNTGPALRFENQARFHVGRYIVGLAGAATRAGVRIRCGRRVKTVTGFDPKRAWKGKVTLYPDDSTLEADHIVVATNTPGPIAEWQSVYMKQSAYRTYMVGMRVREGSVPDALYWDTLDPYHYVRLLHDPKDGYDTLLIGGEDHRTGQGASGWAFEKLVAWALKVFPQIEHEVCRWSGQVQEPVDGLGYIGRAPSDLKNVYVITGDSGMGLTHGTLGAMLITDLIAKRENPWAKIYDPARTPINTELVTENTNTTRQYADYITAGEIKDETELKPGQGGLMRSGLTKLALYRDDDGTLHKMSAVCPHMKCIVHWNGVEKSWDCPCHGSRFDCHGKLVIGPAFSDLPKAE